MEIAPPRDRMIQYRDLLSDTICAPVTAPGHAGVAVIRISGDNAFKYTAQTIENRDLSPETHRCYLTSIVDQNNVKIDQVLLTFFEKGKSFTGDETVEISCHGNPLLINSIIQRFLQLGCRSAERGEFSFRAYYNGKIDLVQAESIQSLVTTRLQTGSRAFIDQLKGRLSVEFENLQEKIVLAMAHLEASIDFVEEDIETDEMEAVEKVLNTAHMHAETLINSYDIGRSLQKDLKILILGNTNAGKSSLFNKCIEADRAIVTDIEGTTRDLVTGQKYLGSSSVEFVDSAGLRETSDPVENLGIQKSLDETKNADLIMYVVDLQNPGNLDVIQSLPDKKVLMVFNKFDLVHSEEEALQIVNQVFKSCGKEFIEEQVCFVSSVSGYGLEKLLQKSEDLLVSDIKEFDGEALVTQARHYNHLVELNKFLDQALTLVRSQESPDLISQELALGLSEVHQLLGKEYNDEVLDKIFSQFCIGK